MCRVPEVRDWAKGGGGGGGGSYRCGLNPKGLGPASLAMEDMVSPQHDGALLGTLNKRDRLIIRTRTACLKHVGASRGT